MKEKTVLQKFAKRMRELRKMKKMSQEKLAEKADVSLTFVGYLERAEKNPTLTTLGKIAKALDISLSEFLGFPDDKKITDVDAQTIDKAVKILKQALKEAEGYKNK